MKLGRNHSKGVITSKMSERVMWLLLVFAVTLALVPLTSTAVAGRFSWGDKVVVELVLRYRFIVMDWTMLLISWVSSGYGVTVILVSLLVLLWRSNRSAILYGIAVILSSTLWQLLLKAMIGRPRPEPLFYPVWHGAGYPSGHMLTSVVMIYMLWRLALYYDLTRWTTVLRYAVVIWPLLVGFSRIYLNVHYLSDVIGGCLLGIWHLGLVFGIFGSGWLNVGQAQKLHQDDLGMGKPVTKGTYLS